MGGRTHTSYGVEPGVDDGLAQAMVELWAVHDDGGSVVDYVLGAGFSSNPSACDVDGAHAAQRRLVDVFGRLAPAIAEELERAASSPTGTTFEVTLAGRTKSVTAFVAGPGRIMTLWSDVTELRALRCERRQHPDDADAALNSTDRLVAIVDRDGVCRAAWPGLWGRGRASHQFVDRVLADVVGFDPLAAMPSSDCTLNVALLDDGRRVVTIGDAPSERAERDLALQEIADLRAMLDVADVDVARYEAVRDDAGRIIDFTCVALNTSHRDPSDPVDGLVGRRLLTLFPQLRGNGVFDAYVAVVETGEPWEPDPRRYELDGRPYGFRLRAHAHRDGFVLSWRAASNDPRACTTMADADGRGAASPVGGPRYRLNERHARILTRVAQGATTEQISRELYLSPFTVRNEIRRVLTHLGARSRAEAIATALRHGLIDLRASTIEE